MKLKRTLNKDWHPWFAWRPVELDDLLYSWVWLETIERRIEIWNDNDDKILYYRLKSIDET